MQMNISVYPSISLLLFLQSAPYRDTFAAFQNDCEAMGIPWYSLAAQKMCVALLIKNPRVVQCPPRKANLRAFLKHYIAQLDQPHVTKALEESGAEEVMDANLMDEFIHLTVSGEREMRETMCYKTFYCPYTKGEHLYIPVRVSSGHYDNVGLTLWPSGYVLVQLLAQELATASPLMIPAEGKLRVLELGAGVGLTPLMLQRHEGYQRRVSSYILSDYHVELVENMTLNLRNNGISLMSKSSQQDWTRNKEQCDVQHFVKLIDWNELERNEEKFRKWSCNVILAADCIYAVDTIDPFVKTIHLALCAKPGAVAIVVQSHRQDKTMKLFFDALYRTNIRVCSFRADPVTTSTPNGGGGTALLQSYVNDPRLGLGSSGFVISLGEVTETGHLKHSDSHTVRSAIPSMANSASTSCFDLEQLDGAWIGTFFTKLEGPIGIHVLTL